MSKLATGRVLDLDGKGIAGLNIDIEEMSQLHDGGVLNDGQTPPTDNSAVRFSSGVAVSRDPPQRLPHGDDSSPVQVFR